MSAPLSSIPRGLHERQLASAREHLTEAMRQIDEGYLHGAIAELAIAHSGLAQANVLEYVARKQEQAESEDAP